MRTPEQMRNFIRESSVEDEKGCWIWQRHQNSDGYGTLRWGRERKTHRASFSVFKGEIPPGMEVCHSCDRPPCCNPEHLFLGTHAENMKDCARKKRIVAAKGEQRHNARLSEADIQTIREEYAKGGVRQVDLAKKWGLSQGHVSHLIIGRKWACVPRK